MTKPRTHEEIAHDIWLLCGAPEGVDEGGILAALREAADARDKEWSTASERDGSHCDFPQFLATYIDGLLLKARQEEREALREWAVKDYDTAPFKIPLTSLLAWLDARSRGEEPQP